MKQFIPKLKKCKGTGRAIGNGCGQPKKIHKYGLCVDCFKKWIYDTPEGQKYLKSIQISSKKHVEKEQKKEDRIKKEESRKKSWYEAKLQDEINEIVRLIDCDKGCISCEHGWNEPATRRWHSGHRISVGSNPTLRYNLFDIFKQCSICNNWKSANEREYDKGIIKHYGIETLEYIKSLPAKYTSLHISIEELKEAIKKARDIKKEIISGHDYTREEINNKIGIYKP